MSGTSLSGQETKLCTARKSNPGPARSVVTIPAELRQPTVITKKLTNLNCVRVLDAVCLLSKFISSSVITQGGSELISKTPEFL